MTELQRANAELQRVRSLIDAIESVDYKRLEIDSNGTRRAVEKHDLPSLYEREKQLLARVNRLQGGTWSRVGISD